MAEKMDKYKRNLIVKDLAFELMLNSAINILKKFLEPFLKSWPLLGQNKFTQNEAF